ncbi:MAG: hypothetical protein ACREBF_03715 [Candidatus Micrarchaeales archaeon]
MQNLSEKEKLSLTLALAVVVLSIVSIATFLLTGGSIVFYIVELVAVILAFLMIYYISRLEEQGTKKQKGK